MRCMTLGDTQVERAIFYHWMTLFMLGYAKQYFA